MLPVESAVAIGKEGLRGDASRGSRRRQVLLIEQGMLDEFGLAPGQVRENVVVAGLPLAGLPPGTRLRMGEALAEVTGDCTPCEYIEAIRPGLRQAMQGRRGTLTRILRGGEIRLGAEVTVLPEAVVE